jgi:hypothetical protein
MKHAQVPWMRRRLLPRMTRRTATITGVVVALVAVAGAALAYFTARGSTTGPGVTGAVTVSIDATTGTPGTPLYPGQKGDVTLQVNNPAHATVTLVSVAQITDSTITASGGCTQPDLTFTPQTGLHISIPANATNYQVDLPGAATLSGASPNSCQGATFSIPVTITVELG